MSHKKKTMLLEIKTFLHLVLAWSPATPAAPVTLRRCWETMWCTAFGTLYQRLPFIKKLPLTWELKSLHLTHWQRITYLVAKWLNSADYVNSTSSWQSCYVIAVTRIACMLCQAIGLLWDARKLLVTEVGPHDT